MIDNKPTSPSNDHALQAAFNTLFTKKHLPTLTQLRKDEAKRVALATLEAAYGGAVPARHRKVLRRVTGLVSGTPEAASHVAQDLAVSRERIRAMTSQALKHLKGAASKAPLHETVTTNQAEGSSTAINLYQGEPMEQAVRLASLPPGDLRREAMSAANARDAERLWALMDAFLTLHGSKGSTVSERTRRNYRRGLKDLLRDWTHENLLRPRRDAGVTWIRQLERRPVVNHHTGEVIRDPVTGDVKRLSPATIQVKLSAARTLYKALRWAGATKETPFETVRVVRDPVPAWEKRGAYTPEEVGRLLEFAEPADQVMVLLGAHAGLRIAEIARLAWGDIDWRSKELVVREGKGRKTARVAMTKRLREALNALRTEHVEVGFVLPFRAYRARERFKQLCQRAGIAYEGRAVHGLRHGAGTRVYQQFHDLGRVAQHLRQASVDTARRYAKMADKVVHEGIEEW